MPIKLDELAAIADEGSPVPVVVETDGVLGFGSASLVLADAEGAWVREDLGVRRYQARRDSEDLFLAPGGGAARLIRYRGSL